MYKKVFAATFVCLVSLIAFGVNPVTAGERPPAGAKSLSDIVKSLEDRGYSPITEVSIDNRVWEVEAYKDGHERELRVNPATAEIISDRADD